MGQRVVGSPVRRSRVLTTASLSTDSAWTAYGPPVPRRTQSRVHALPQGIAAPQPGIAALQPGSGCCTSSALGGGKTDMSLGFRHEPQTEASLNKAEPEVPRFAFGAAPSPRVTRRALGTLFVGGSDRPLCAHRSAVKCSIAFLTESRIV